ncbi:MAG: DUF2800 domain-containing protein [Opitutaceae bacterium]|nr:DUF2800 domain-containing protein [Opitutaceae bacterium]
MNTSPDNERAGMPSGSGAERWLTCPGAQAAEAGKPDPQTEDAAEGDFLHEVMARGVSPVKDEHHPLIDFCRETRDRLVVDLLAADRGAPIIEERLWLRDADLEPVASCRVDYAIGGLHAAQDGAAMLAIDYKFGRRGADSAEINAQLRFTAAVLGQEFSPDVVFVAIVAPRAEGERVTVAKFTGQQCAAAHREMVAAAKRAMLPNQPRNPSPKACHYCRARGTSACPESIAAATALSIVPGAELSSDVLATLLDRCDMADRVIDAMRTEAKRRIEAGAVIPGWRLKPGATSKKVSAKDAWAKIGQQIGGSAFAECCTVSFAVPRLRLEVPDRGQVGQGSAGRY